MQTNIINNKTIPNLQHDLLHVGLAFIFGILLLTVSSYISIPFFPVPLTLQTAAVLFLGMAFGWRMGVSTVSTYLLLGFIGTPVFAIGAFSPSIGYLLGFLPAVAICGIAADKELTRTIVGAAITGLIANVAIYVCGLSFLTIVLAGQHVLEFGLYPFVFGACLKVAFLALFMPLFWYRFLK